MVAQIWFNFPAQGCVLVCPRVPPTQPLQYQWKILFKPWMCGGVLDFYIHGTDQFKLSSWLSLGYFGLFKKPTHFYSEICQEGPALNHTSAYEMAVRFLPWASKTIPQSYTDLYYLLRKSCLAWIVSSCNLVSAIYLYLTTRFCKDACFGNFVIYTTLQMPSSLSFLICGSKLACLHQLVWLHKGNQVDFCFLNVHLCSTGSTLSTLISICWQEYVFSCGVWIYRTVE